MHLYLIDRLVSFERRKPQPGTIRIGKKKKKLHMVRVSWKLGDADENTRIMLLFQVPLRDHLHSCCSVSIVKASILQSNERSYNEIVKSYSLYVDRVVSASHSLPTGLGWSPPPLC